MRIRNIENSWWVDKVFITKKRIYLINSFFESNLTYVCFIKLEDYYSLTKKGNVIRHHVMCPPFIVNNTMTCGLSNTNMHISLTLKYEVVNIFEIEDNIYLQYLSDNIVKTILLNDENDYSSLETLDNYDNKITIQKYNKIYQLDLKSNILIFNNRKIIDSINIIKFIIFKDCLIILDKFYSLYIFRDQKLELIKELKNKANIFWINDNNFLLSSIDENKTLIYNVETQEFSKFLDHYLLFFCANDKIALTRTADYKDDALTVDNSLIMID